MRTRSAARVHRIGFPALAFTVILAVFACGGAIASDVERRIPVSRDAAGSGLTLEISRDGARQTATPFLTVYDPTVRRIEDRIAKKVAEFSTKGIADGAALEKSISGIGRTRDPREGFDPHGTALASSPPVPGEITLRSVRRFIKGLRSSRGEKPAPAVEAPFKEVRLGRADASVR